MTTLFIDKSDLPIELQQLITKEVTVIEFVKYSDSVKKANEQQLSIKEYFEENPEELICSWVHDNYGGFFSVVIEDY